MGNTHASSNPSSRKKAVKDVFGLDDPVFAKTQVKVFGSTVDTTTVIDGFKFSIDNLRRMMV